MRDYRLYKLDTNGKITSVPIVLRCEDDDAALTNARQHIDKRAMEIWIADRRVAFIPSDSSE